MGGDVKRRYDASGRRAQALQNQRRILSAAHDLFVTQGYGQTTIVEVAKAAGLAPETVYSAFRNKPTLLHRTWDAVVGGDEAPVLVHERPEIRAVLAEPRLAKRLHRFAEVNTAIMRRTGPLHRAVQGAAASDHNAAAMLGEIDRQRLEAMGVHARAAAATGELGVSEAECRDVFFATTDGSLWHSLVGLQGWSDQRYAAWLGQLWVSMLASGLGGEDEG